MVERDAEDSANVSCRWWREMLKIAGNSDNKVVVSAKPFLVKHEINFSNPVGNHTKASLPSKQLPTGLPYRFKGHR